MTDEDFNKKMEFIIERQAQSAARLGQLEDIVSRPAQAAPDRFEATDQKIDGIDERISALVNSRMRTAENMKNLIAVVDR